MNKKEPCGLLGRKLGHSYSPIIHRQIADYEYGFFEVEPEDVNDFFARREFMAINVTMPYKKVALEACDFVSDEARAIGSVNTVVKDAEGRLHGYNTDAPGMVYMLRKAGIEAKGRKCMILGSGGSSVMAQYMLKKMGAKEVVVISRGGENNYDNIDRHSDAEIIINATPVGMYPDTGKAAIDINRFPACVGVADFIYNPAATKLLLDARRAGIRHTNGTPMLAAQAKYASDLFLGTERSDDIIGPIVENLARSMRNIIVMCSSVEECVTLGRDVAAQTGREIIDLTEEKISPELLNEHCKQSGKLILLPLFAPDAHAENALFQNGVLFTDTEVESLVGDIIRFKGNTREVRANEIIKRMA